MITKQPIAHNPDTGDMLYLYLSPDAPGRAYSAARKMYYWYGWEADDGTGNTDNRGGSGSGTMASDATGDMEE
jgi:hypothetical protein